MSDTMISERKYLFFTASKTSTSVYPRYRDGWFTISYLEIGGIFVLLQPHHLFENIASLQIKKL